MKLYSRIATSVLVSTLLTTSLAHAASQALLVNVGDYQNEAITDLYATSRDVSIMRELLQQNSIFGDEVITLSDQQATYQNVRDALRNMIAQLNDNEIALFYFSGHGGQFKDTSGDETDDHRDEALILYDSVWDFESARNVLLDDELAEIYASIDKGKLIVLVDACNSGSLDKGIAVRGMKPRADAASSEILGKSLGYKDVSAKFVDTQQYTEVTRSADNAVHYVALHAANDDELALLSPDGSYFTLGLQDALRSTAADQLTPALLTQRATDFIKGKVPPDRNFEPQLRGNPALFEKGLWLASTPPVSASPPPPPASPVSDTQSAKPVQTQQTVSIWDKFDRLTQKFPHPDFTLAVDPGDSISIGEFYSLTLNLPFSGYVSVVAVDQGSNEPVILYPNKFMPDETKYPAGPLVLPPESAFFWGLQAQEPPSTTQFVAIVSFRPLNLYAKAQSKGAANASEGVYALLNPVEVDTLSRATGVAATIAAVKKIVNIVPR